MQPQTPGSAATSPVSCCHMRMRAVMSRMRSRWAGSSNRLVCSYGSERRSNNSPWSPAHRNEGYSVPRMSARRGSDCLELGEKIEHPDSGFFQLVRRVADGPVPPDAYCGIKKVVMPAPAPIRIRAGVDTGLNLFPVDLQLVEYLLVQLLILRRNIERHPCAVDPVKRRLVTENSRGRGKTDQCSHSVSAKSSARR